MFSRCDFKVFLDLTCFAIGLERVFIRRDPSFARGRWATIFKVWSVCVWKYGMDRSGDECDGTLSMLVENIFSLFWGH